MPKKFSGENTKAVAAKAKKQKSKDEQALKQKEELVDEWVDTCKIIEKKLKRREDKEEKRLEQLKRKKELTELLKKECEVSYKCKNKTQPKLTRGDIEQKIAAKKELIKGEKKIETHLTTSLTENLNRLTLGEELATTIDAALLVLSEEPPIQDRHPEKRLKAAHKAYEERRLKELKAVYPNMKLSQLKEMIFKEWQKLQHKR